MTKFAVLPLAPSRNSLVALSNGQGIQPYVSHSDRTSRRNGGKVLLGIETRYASPKAYHGRQALLNRIQTASVHPASFLRAVSGHRPAKSKSQPLVLGILLRRHFRFFFNTIRSRSDIGPRARPPHVLTNEEVVSFKGERHRRSYRCMTTLDARRLPRFN
jgi:hypothetical protein